MIIGIEVPKARTRRKADVLPAKKKWEMLVNTKGESP